MKGKHHSDESKEKISNSLKGKKHTKERKKKISESHKGIIQSEETRIKKSCSNRGIERKDFDGFAKPKYCEKFNNELKEKIRNKYNRECFICSKPESDNKYRLSIHHVNMDKMCGCNNNECILIPLCICVIEKYIMIY